MLLYTLFSIAAEAIVQTYEKGTSMGLGENGTGNTLALGIFDPTLSAELDVHLSYKHCSEISISAPDFGYFFALIMEYGGSVC